MAYCPRCEQEYEAHVTVCADCDVPLAPTLAAARSAAAAAEPASGAPASTGPVAESDIEPAFPEVAFYCPDARLAAALERCLNDEQIPTFRYETPVDVDGTTQHRIAVPPEFANYAVRLVGAKLGRSVSRLGQGVLVGAPVEKDSKAASPLPEEIASRIEAAEKRCDGGVAELAALIRMPAAPGVREAAARALARIDSASARAASEEALRSAIAAKDDAAFHEIVIGMGAGSPWTLGAATLALISSSGDAEVRALAASAAGHLHCEEALESLVGALSDADVSVRSAGIEALFLLTGERLSFEADGAAKERAAAAARWREFLDCR